MPFRFNEKNVLVFAVPFGAGHVVYVISAAVAGREARTGGPNGSEKACRPAV